MLDKLKEFAKQLNSLGIPLPMVRDPKTGMASVSLTLVVLSSIYVQVGLIGKYSKLLDGIDLNQAMNFFLISAGLYFGRNLSTPSVTSTPTNKDNNNAQ
jgi:hypothetical protein